MRILYIIPYPSFFSQISNMGGHVAHVIGVVQGLKDLGHRVTVLTEESFELLDEIADEVVRVPGRSNSFLARLFWNFKFTNRAKQFQGKVDFVYMRYSAGFSPFISRVKQAFPGLPLMLEVNSFLSQRKSFARHFEGRLMEPADHILTVSERNRDEMNQLFGSLLKSKILVVTNGVDLNRFPSWENAVTRDWNYPVVLGYTGIIKEFYGLDVMIRGYELLRSQGANVSFKMVGDGPYRETLQQRYGGVAGLDFVGPQAFNQMPEILSEIDVLVNSASVKNAFQSPTKMFEYMASGRPILSARTPPCESLLKGGELGALYEIDDANGFSRAAQRILKKRKVYLHKARAARSEAEKHHSWTAKCQSFLSEIEAEDM